MAEILKDVSHSSPGWKYCEEALTQVGRTFALHTKILNGELHRCVVLGYLICRILDTIEDSPSLNPQLKIQFLRQFPQLYQSDNWEKSIEAWVNRLMDESLDGKQKDIDLVKHTTHVISCFKSLPSDYQRQGKNIFHHG